METGLALSEIDTTTPHSARMYNALLGGKDNFEADRVAAEQVLALVRGLRWSTSDSRNGGQVRTRGHGLSERVRTPTWVSTEQRVGPGIKAD